MSENNTDEEESLPLSALNGAVLTWEDADGNTHSVEFSDSTESNNE